MKYSFNIMTAFFLFCAYYQMLTAQRNITLQLSAFGFHHWHHEPLVFPEPDQSLVRPA